MAITASLREGPQNSHSVTSSFIFSHKNAYKIYITSHRKQVSFDQNKTKQFPQAPIFQVKVVTEQSALPCARALAEL